MRASECFLVVFFFELPKLAEDQSVGGRKVYKVGMTSSVSPESFTVVRTHSEKLWPFWFSHFEFDLGHQLFSFFFYFAIRCCFGHRTVAIWHIDGPFSTYWFAHYFYTHTHTHLRQGHLQWCQIIRNTAAERVKAKQRTRQTSPPVDGLFIGLRVKVFQQSTGKSRPSPAHVG